MRRSRLAVVAVVTGVAACAGASYWSAETARHSGRLDGLCIALDMVSAHGLLDGPKRSMVTDALASPVNPWFDRLDVGRAEIVRRCRRIADERWQWE